MTQQFDSSLIPAEEQHDEHFPSRIICSNCQEKFSQVDDEDICPLCQEEQDKQRDEKCAPPLVPATGSILPCPFCGGASEPQVMDGGRECVRCTTCFAEGPSVWRPMMPYGGSWDLKEVQAVRRERAIERWNSRSNVASDLSPASGDSQNQPKPPLAGD